MYPGLEKHISYFASPDISELDRLSDALQPIDLKSKEHLLRAGDLCKYQYFVEKGCFRTYLIDHLGNEKTINFSIEGWWMSDLESYHREVAGHLFIQAIEASQVLRISKENLENILNDSLELNRYFRKIGERVRLSDQRRIEFMFRLTGREMFDLFCQANPEFVQRVPQYMLASYLGFTPEFLSKIRKQKAEEGK